MESVIIRDIIEKDVKRVLEIYTYYIENTAITFECEVPSLTEFRTRVENIIKRYPFIVAELDGAVMGYAYAGAFNERSAYDHSSELSIYLEFTVQKAGLGRKLYEELEHRLSEMGILNLYACIAFPEADDEYLTKNSAEFHSHMGFKTVGEFHQCGYKFGRWYDMIWMEKMIGSHRSDQPPVNFFNGHF